MRHTTRAMMWCATLLAMPACTAGDARLQVRAYGEAFIEQQIPADEMEDGWAITFSQFEVTLAQIEVGGATIAQAGPLDLTMASEGKGQLIDTVTVTSGDLGTGSYTVTALHIKGSAQKEGITKSFDWEIAHPVRYERCHTDTTLEAGEEGVFQITIHADHLFYDSLVSEDPALRFDRIASADADEDGQITRAELEQVGIGPYDPGNEDVKQMWQWIVSQSATLGHINGEGHCDASLAQ